MKEADSQASEHARALSALGAAKGGKARKEALTPEERSEIARHAAEQRWSARPAGLPRETHTGILPIGDKEIPCGVLENGIRVLSTRGVTRALGGRQTGTRGAQGGSQRGAPQLPPFLTSAAIRPFISDELLVRLIAPIEYKPVRGGRTAFGYEARLLPDICRIILAARRAKALKSNQLRFADAAEILLNGLADVGIIALVDEVTGYQADRARDELMRILEAYISKALLPWVQRFPDDFFKEIYRLHGWQFKEGQTRGPRVVGRLINKLVYEQLPPGVLQELNRRNPIQPYGYRRYKHHQYLTEDIGHPHLNSQVASVMTLMRVSDNKDQFIRFFEKAFPKKWQQMRFEYEEEKA